MQARFHSPSPVLGYSRLRLWLPVWVIVVASSGGCSSAAQPAARHRPAHASLPLEPSVVEAPTRLPALSESERKLVTRLRLHAAKLTELGERTASKDWNLAAATDYISLTLEASGYEVNRQGFTSEGRVAQNLEVRLPGSRLGHQWILLGARFDSRPGSTGADDNASGAAALLVLSEVMAKSRAQRSVKFVFFSDASDRSDPTSSGSHHSAAQLPKNPPAEANAGLSNPTDGAPSAGLDAAPRHETLLMLEFGGVGVFSLTPGSQKYPEYAVRQTPSIGEFVALAGYAGEEHSPLAAFALELENVASLPVQRWVLSTDEPLVSGAAHRDFRRLGIPSGLLFDTHALRSPHFGGTRDTLETLDFERMARVVEGLYRALPVLIGPPAAEPAQP